MSRGLQWLVGLSIAALSGVATALAFAPFGLWPLALLGVAGVLAVQWRTTSGRSATFGFFYGFAFFVVLLQWMTVIGTDAWLLLAAYCALWNAALGSLVGPLSRLRGGTLWVASGWVVMEALRGRVPLGGFPWGEIAFSQGNSPLAALTPLAGMAGVTFLVVWIAALAIESVRRRRWRAVGVVVVLAFLVSFVIPRPFEFGGESSTAVVAVVQGGTPGTGMEAMGTRRAVLQTHIDQTFALAAAIDAGEEARPQFVLWPENSSDIDPYQDPSVAADISAAAAAVGVPIVVGAVVETVDPTMVENTGIVWDPTTGPGDTYVKNHPVPFGEFVPFREQLAPLIGRFERVPRDFVRGSSPGVLEVGGIVIGDVICFEVAYDDVFIGVIDGGAQLITVQTNNATYQGSGQPEQQWDIERLRALQAGRAVVVASTTGVSGFIEPDGVVTARMDEGERGYIVQGVSLRTGRTPSTVLGAIPEIIAGGALLTGLIIYMYVHARRQARTSRSSDVRVEP
jgi:apolipoprotein N-acyltransferase